MPRRPLILALAASLVLAAPVSAQELAPILSAEARFHPVIAENGMVASQEALATTVGVDILKRGGNAVDAAVAVGFALAVTLPRAGNLGGGGFMLVHRADSAETVAIDYRELAPAAAHRDIFLDEAGNADAQKSRYSALAIGVPGTVAGLALAHERYGSGRFTLADLIAPAIRLADEGFPVGPGLARSLVRAAPRLTKDAEAKRIFYSADGTPPAVGTILSQPDLAASLTAIAENGPEAFYRGAIGEKIAAALNARGGIMTTEDLATYEAKIRVPVRGSYRGYEIVSMPPPSSGGVHLVQILNMLESAPIGELGANSAATIHLFAEAARRAYADRARYLGDPDFVEVPVAKLTDPAYASRLAATISPDRATPSEEIIAGALIDGESNETTHFSVVDGSGNAVANTYTLN
ncbi:MAG: gamma-glutamyltransferase, partial [Hyphomicrobiales bacterium]|nr:gamma-glutamyltransferase [Hyphomicrobiales bacterium]